MPAIYIGSENGPKEIKDIYIGVNNKPVKVLRAYIGVNNQPKRIFGLPKIGTALNDMTWKEIREISDSGLASKYFSVGDTKTITINGTVGKTTFTNLSVEAFIIGINHNSGTEGNNRIHFQIGKINGKDIGLCDKKYSETSFATGYFSMNTTNSTRGGWESSNMRTAILGSNSIPENPTSGTLLAALPVDLRSVMKSVTKYTDNNGKEANISNAVTATTDYLWLLSESEVFSQKRYAHSGEQSKQAQYKYYEDKNDPLKYKHDDVDKKSKSWLRSPATAGSIFTGYTFCFIETNSAVNAAASAASFSIAPAFAV